jgi:NTE family protein
MSSGVVDDESLDRLLRATAVFGGLDPDARMLLRKELEPRIARRGEVLIHQDDAGDGLYLVGSGRFHAVITKGDDSRTVIDEIGRGHLIGEMALLTARPRSATIIALRDSHVFFLSTDAFDRVVQAHPQALRVISTALIDRLMDTIRRGPMTMTSPVTSIAIVPLDDSDHVRGLGPRLAAALEPLVGAVPVVTDADIRADLGEAPSDLARATWREHVESSHEVVIYVGEPEFGPWTGECASQADLVILAASASSARGLRSVEHELHRQRGSIPQRMELVLLHEATTVTPRGTRNWLAPREIDRHHHIRVDRGGDYERVARLLVGRGVGVVFSGGGARGIAHIGVLRALRERGVPIDATGGASFGAIVAGAVARGDAPDDVAALIRAAVVDQSPVDLTFPVVSVASGARVTEHIKKGAQHLDLEDFWLNTFCVSTNLARGSLEIHSRGSAWMAIRSSFSVPGLFPPMSNDAGELLVDGGLLDNMPVKQMRTLHAGIEVIGIDVAARREFPSARSPSTGVISGWRQLVSTVRQRKVDSLSSLPRVLMRLTELGSLADDDLGDCYIRPALSGVSLLDFDRFDELVESGQRAAEPVLDDWLVARAAAAT